MNMAPAAPHEETELVVISYDLTYFAGIEAGLLVFLGEFDHVGELLMDSPWVKSFS